MTITDQRGFALILFGARLVEAPVALAQPSPADAQYAEQLFQEAKGDMTEGRVDLACTKLEAVRRIDGGGGTVLALAMCHEKQGREATALAEFREARLLADRAHREDRVRLADEHLVRIDAEVSRLSLVVARDRVAGMKLELDGVPVDETQWGVALPVDKGSHVVIAKVPGRPPWQVTVLARPAGDRLSVDVAPWPAPAAVQGTAAAEPHANGLSRARVGALVLAGVGVVGLGLGSYFGIVAIDKRNDAVRTCGSTSTCASPVGLALDRQSSEAGLISTVAFTASAAALATGTVLWFVGRPQRAPAGPAALRVGAFPVSGGAALSVESEL